MTWKGHLFTWTTVGLIIWGVVSCTGVIKDQVQEAKKKELVKKAHQCKQYIANNSDIPESDMRELAKEWAALYVDITVDEALTLLKQANQNKLRECNSIIAENSRAEASVTDEQKSNLTKGIDSDTDYDYDDCVIYLQTLNDPEADKRVVEWLTSWAEQTGRSVSKVLAQAQKAHKEEVKRCKDLLNKDKQQLE